MDRVCLLQAAIESVDRHFFRLYPYPLFIVVASDYQNAPGDGEYTPEDRANIRALVPHSTVTFIEVEMYSGEGLEANMSDAQWKRWMSREDGGVRGKHPWIGYHAMCRLWSGRLQNMAFLQPYKYYMRMDDDSALFADLSSDPFKDMESKSLQYAYKMTTRWWLPQSDPTWQIARPWMTNEALKGMHQLGLLKCREECVSNISWECCHFDGTQPYNNFHVATVSMWRSPAWLGWMQEAEKIHAWFKFNLGDAEAHSFAVGMLGRPEQVAVWKQMPYAHNKKVPGGYPKPEYKANCKLPGRPSRSR